MIGIAIILGIIVLIAAIVFLIGFVYAFSLESREKGVKMMIYSAVTMIIGFGSCVGMFRLF